MSQVRQRLGLAVTNHDLRKRPWSSMKADLGNLAATVDQLAAAMRKRLARIQRQPALIAGFLGQTGLTLGSRAAVATRPGPFSLCSG